MDQKIMDALLRRAAHLRSKVDIFTREDVEALDDAIYMIHGPKMDALHPGIEQALDSIKERIEALLPPEE